MPTEHEVVDASLLEHLKKAVAEGKRSKAEDNRPHPKVGAVLLKGEETICAHRGELSEGDHAEYTLFERKLTGGDLHDAILITTLEPCTTRNHPKTPCALRAISRRVSKVYIGILDPNPDIYGKGRLALEAAGIEVEMFPEDLAAEIRSDNEAFIAAHQKPPSGDPKTRRLDDWYFSVNSIYFDGNFYRDVNSVFTHLVEVMGGLSLLATEKHKPDVDTDTYLAKALAWWLGLCGKVGVRSVEDLLWSKFPFVCPYCRKCPHDEDTCAEAKRRDRNPDWVQLAKTGESFLDRRPKSLSGWQRMYGQIFPASQTERYELVFGRFTEELGELAEAIRIGTVAPGYLISEAADVFAWLMKLINIIESKKHIPAANRGHALEEVMWQQYPNKCVECGNAVCNCPPLLAKTLGRIGHEGPDPNLLQSSGAFMTPSETAAFFEVGSKQLVIGRVRLAATSDIIEQSRAVVRDLRSFADEHIGLGVDLTRQLRAVAEAIEATTQRDLVNDRDIQNLIRSISLMPVSVRSDLLMKVVVSAPALGGALQRAFNTPVADPL